MTEHQQWILNTNQELKLVRKDIRRLKAIEDSLCNRLERLLIENQTQINLKDEQERDNGEQGVHSTSREDGFDTAEII